MLRILQPQYSFVNVHNDRLQPALRTRTPNSFVQRYTRTETQHLPRYRLSPCTSHLIPIIAQRKDSSVTIAPVPAEASGNSQSVCYFQTSCLCLITLTVCTYLLLCSRFLSHFLSPLLSSSPFSFSSLLALSPLLLSDLSFSPVQRLHNAHQLFRGSLLVSPAHPIRAGLCTNGLLLYLLPAPTHSRDYEGRQRRQLRRWEDVRKR